MSSRSTMAEVCNEDDRGACHGHHRPRQRPPPPPRPPPPRIERTGSTSPPRMARRSQLSSGGRARRSCSSTVDCGPHHVRPSSAALRDRFTTFSLDRRGFGASGNAPGYSIECDFEDVAAVVHAVAERTGGPVGLWATPRSQRRDGWARRSVTEVHHLVLYEPSLGITYAPGSIERIEASLAAGDPEAAIGFEVFSGILEMSDEEIEEVQGRAVVAGSSGGRPAPSEMPRRRRLGVRARSVRPGRRTDAPPVRVGERGSGGEGHRCRAAAAIPDARIEVLRRSRALRPQDGSRDGRGPRQPLRHTLTAAPVSSRATR